MTESDWDDVIDTNLKGTFLAIKAVLKTMMSQKYGRIINIGSVVGSIGNAGQANYAASKAGLIGLTKSVAKELASRNILVNLIAPGYVRTDMTEKLTEEQKDFFVKNIPLKRVAEPKEIADSVIFLSSDLSNYITGEVLHINGGLYM
jgi:3-oxoacyl-[acyl-carrier protein] reductase